LNHGDRKTRRDTEKAKRRREGEKEGFGDLEMWRCEDVKISGWRNYEG